MVLEGEWDEVDDVAWVMVMVMVGGDDDDGARVGESLDNTSLSIQVRN